MTQDEMLRCAALDHRFHSQDIDFESCTDWHCEMARAYRAAAYWRPMSTAPKNREIMVWRLDVRRAAFVIWTPVIWNTAGGWYHERGRCLDEARLAGWRQFPEGP